MEAKCSEDFLFPYIFKKKKKWSEVTFLKLVDVTNKSK